MRALQLARLGDGPNRKRVAAVQASKKKLLRRFRRHRGAGHVRRPHRLDLLRRRNHFRSAFVDDPQAARFGPLGAVARDALLADGDRLLREKIEAASLRVVGIASSGRRSAFLPLLAGIADESVAVLRDRSSFDSDRIPALLAVSQFHGRTPRSSDAQEQPPAPRAKKYIPADQKRQNAPMVPRILLKLSGLLALLILASPQCPLAQVSRETPRSENAPPFRQVLGQAVP